MGGGRVASESETSNRGAPDDRAWQSSTDFSGTSGSPTLFESGPWPCICCGESFLFFVEDVVNASCLCSSVLAGGNSVSVARKALI